MKEQICYNCGGDTTVTVHIPCPDCKGNNVNEIDALRNLAIWIENNFRSRSKPPSYGLNLINDVLRAQNKKLIKGGEDY